MVTIKIINFKSNDSENKIEQIKSLRANILREAMELKKAKQTMKPASFNLNEILKNLSEKKGNIYVKDRNILIINLLFIGYSSEFIANLNCTNLETIINTNIKQKIKIFINTYNIKGIIFKKVNSDIPLSSQYIKNLPTKFKKKFKNNGFSYQTLIHLRNSIIQKLSKKFSTKVLYNTKITEIEDLNIDNIKVFSSILTEREIDFICVDFRFNKKISKKTLSNIIKKEAKLWELKKNMKI